MFGKKKNKDEKKLDKKLVKKKKGIMDKLVMGAIIGGAIGSVVGMSVAPKTGKETRGYIVEQGAKAKKEGVKILSWFKKLFKKKD
ncbi:YtxH domain-containing protein [Candidatus Peregrinibacteria bacterium]|nr:YtxH domain-containing protein [Candidatus Peregrinibacteria bacterium]